MSAVLHVTVSVDICLYILLGHHHQVNMCQSLSLNADASLQYFRYVPHSKWCIRKNEPYLLGQVQ